MKSTWLAMLMLFMALNVFGQTIHYVSLDGTHQTPFTNWATASSNIQAAIDISANGDKVIVNAGTYAGVGNRDLLINGKNIKVVSESGPFSTIIDCGGAARAIRFMGSMTNTLFAGFTIQNASYSELVDWGSGGLLQVDDPAAPIIERCVLQSNTVVGVYPTAQPALVSILTRSPAYFRNCLVVNNKITGGYSSGAFGAIIRSGGGVGRSTNYIHNVTMTHNTVSGDRAASILFCRGELANIIDWDNPGVSQTTTNTYARYYSVCSQYLIGSGILTNDPQFMATTNYSLKSTSPYINAGTNASWMTNAIDLNGYPRISGSSVDLGSYETGPYPQSITFVNPGLQQITNTVVLLASVSSRLPVTFAVANGPGTITGGTNLTFSGTGQVSIVASQAGNVVWSPAPAITNTFAVIRGIAQVTLYNLSQTYNGSNRIVTATTVPSGLVVYITYNGSLSAPVSAGSYVVTGVVDDVIYYGTKTGTLVVTKASQAITFPNPRAQITTNAVKLGATASSGLPVSFQVSNGPGSITGGSNLTFRGTGLVSIVADQMGDTNWNQAPVITNTFPVYYGPIIGGRITWNGSGLVGVDLAGLPDNPRSDANGYYLISMTSGWSGVSLPSKVGFIFNPTNRLYENISTDQTNQDYLAIGIPLIRVLGNLAFGNVFAGQQPALTMVISNTGCATLTVSGISYPAGFSGAWSGTIAPGGNRSVIVTFLPVAAQNYGGMITVSSDAISGVNTTTVSGVGLTRIINISGNLAFGNVLIGKTSTRPLTISNSGSSSLTVSSISFPPGFSGAWSGSIPAGQSRNVTVTFTPSAKQDYGGQITVNSDKTSGNNTIVASGAGRRFKVPNDYDGDLISDLPVYDNKTGSWYVRSLDGRVLAWAIQWGWSGATTVPGDYDGDGKSDLAVYDEPTGKWYVRPISGPVIAWATQWGWNGAITVPGDYDGDGKSDMAVFDNACGKWYVRTIGGQVLEWATQWGRRGFTTVPGDYDNNYYSEPPFPYGDGIVELGVYDQRTGNWHINQRDSVQWGWNGAITVPGDYDGDGFADLAVYDNANGKWYVRTSGFNGYNGDWRTLAWGLSWGWSGALPVPGDYDGDGCYDMAVFDTKNGYWYIWSNAKNKCIAWAVQWGWAGATIPGGRQKPPTPPPVPSTPADVFVRIPAGAFNMGDAFGDWGTDALPVHPVYVDEFYIATKEVTKSQWDSVYAWALDNGYYFGHDQNWSQGLGKAPNHPVGDIYWEDVITWCNAKSQKEGRTPCYSLNGQVFKGQECGSDGWVYDTGAEVACNWNVNGYRLPSEAEWEKAARGRRIGNRFPWGDTISQSYANYLSTVDAIYRPSYDLSSGGFHPIYAIGAEPYTSPVGSFPANGYGLFDMAGNVWEYCWDWYSPSYYGYSSLTNPRGPGNRTMSQDGRVRRGGSWCSEPYMCTASARGDDYHEGGNDVGFRVVRKP